MFPYKNFLARVKETGLAVQNRFHVVFPNPTVMSKWGDANKKISLMCKSFSVPGIGLATSPERLTGEVREMINDRVFGAASFVFWNESDFNTRDYFEKWIDGIQNPKTRILAYYNDIKTDIEVTVLDKMDKPRYKITLHAAHPKSIGSLTLDNEQTGIMVFDVSMDYHHYSMVRL